MRKFFFIALMSLITAQSFGATVMSAKIDAEKKNILIDVAYGGGCGRHDFSLKMGLCLESLPVQCEAQLIHKTNDSCEALISATVAIPLAQYKLNNPYFKNGSLTITGDRNWQTGKTSQATVILP